MILSALPSRLIRPQGKSTVIFHIIASFLPSTEVTLATCVQNKAVDAIAEKLAACNGRVPFFVFGNGERLGPVARRWTIEAQARGGAWQGGVLMLPPAAAPFKFCCLQS